MRPLLEGCPDWEALAQQRARSPLDPPGWDEAVHHLDGCSRCRPAALASDPTLVFRRLPVPALASDEVSAMLLRVAALRGARELSSSAGARRLPAWRRLAVAAVLVAAVLAVDRTPPLAGRAALVAHQALAAELLAQPVLEELHQPFDNVMQWNGDDLSVVWVLDERLDV
jgi:hypothetical protein